MKEEIWRPIEGFGGAYEVSNIGRVRNINGKIRIPQEARGGYLRVSLSFKGKTYQRCVHRLVADAFMSNPNNLPQINHKDENKKNNVVENLEWCTAKYNSNYGTGISRRAAKRINHPKLSYPVGQYDKEGNLIATYPSISEAVRVTGISKVSIRLCAECRCRKKKRRDGTIYEKRPPKTAGGYKWKLIK